MESHDETDATRYCAQSSDSSVTSDPSFDPCVSSRADKSPPLKPPQQVQQDQASKDVQREAGNDIDTRYGLVRNSPRASASPPPPNQKRRGGVPSNVLSKEIQKFHRWRMGKAAVKPGMAGLLHEFKTSSLESIEKSN